MDQKELIKDLAPAISWPCGDIKNRGIIILAVERGEDGYQQAETIVGSDELLVRAIMNMLTEAKSSKLKELYLEAALKIMAEADSVDIIDTNTNNPNINLN